MAATVSIVQPGKLDAGGRMNLVKIAMDDSYPTGGEAVTPNQLGLTTLTGLVVFPAATGVLGAWNASTSAPKVQAFRPDVASTALTVATASGAITDDDSAASNGTAVNVVPGNGVSALAYLESTTANNADAAFTVGASGPRVLINDNDSPGGVQLYFDEDAASADSRFLCVSPTGADLFIPTSTGAMIRVVHDASAASNGVAVYFDDNGATVAARLLFVSPTNTAGSYTTDDAITLNAGGITVDPTAAAVAEVANGVDLATVVFYALAFGI